MDVSSKRGRPGLGSVWLGDIRLGTRPSQIFCLHRKKLGQKLKSPPEAGRGSHEAHSESAENVGCYCGP